jgi:hypothetical protein
MRVDVLSLGINDDVTAEDDVITFYDLEMFQALGELYHKLQGTLQSWIRSPSLKWRGFLKDIGWFPMTSLKLLYSVGRQSSSQSLLAEHSPIPI